MVILRFFSLFIVIILLSACAPKATVRDFGTFDPKIKRNALYIIPFNTTLVPSNVGEPIFNEFVDQLNKARKQTNIANFVILKEELKEVEPAWLVKQSYVSGDIWGFVESSGCCSTEMKLKSRIYLYEPGKTLPSLEVFVPVEDFFEHSRLSNQAARIKLAKKLAAELVNNIMQRLKF